VGRTDVEDALERLDKLTQEETRTIVAKSFEMTHGIKDGVDRFLEHSCAPHTHNLFLC
jgi:hypothetical protein